MRISDFLSPERVVCHAAASSKKRALEELSQLIAKEQGELTPGSVFDSLLARERLGGTGLGSGVAIPHGRVKDRQQAIGAFVTLQHGIDFDAIDAQPVDLIFALVVPEASTEEHLEMLALLATMFKDADLREKMRRAETPAALYDLLVQWQESH